MQQSIVKFYCFVLQTLLNMLRDLLSRVCTTKQIGRLHKMVAITHSDSCVSVIINEVLRDVPADTGSLRDKPTALGAAINDTRYLNFPFIIHKEYSTVQSEKKGSVNSV
jgi:hypothetical protein